jgi:phosphoglycerate kinase
MKRMRDIRKVDVRGKRVLLRVDYNIELTKQGKVRDTTRILATLPTIQWLLQREARILLVSHRGRPTGRQAKYSLRPFVPILRHLIGRPIVFIATPLMSRATEVALRAAPPRAVVLLENIRFEAGEEDNSRAVAARLASFTDLAVNDAFADSHRAHASIVGVAAYLPMYAGLLLQKEITTLTGLVTRPKRPYVAIIGGAKISTKLGLIKSLLKQADYVLLGGALANTLLQAEGIAIGTSLVEPSMLKAAAGLTSTNTKIKLPVDVIVARSRSARAKTRHTAVGNLGPKDMILDVGPDTIELFSAVIAKAKTVVWNGPMGVYEVPPYNRATMALAKRIAAHRCISVVGGGETVDAIRRSGVANKFTFLSTGGGAMLEFLEGKTLPGVAVTLTS